MAGRPGPALFELLRDKTGTREGSSPAPAAPPQQPVERPIPAPRVAPPPPPAFDRSLTLSMQTIWIALGVAILLGFGIWALAFTSGKRRGEREMAPYVDRTQAPVTEPKDIPTNTNLVTPSPPKHATSPLPAPTPAGGDPRIAGLNYLTLASKLDQETAIRCVNFLTDNGVPAFAVPPVAKAGSRANNPPSYTVYALQGVSREQMLAKTPEKTELEDRVKRLGKIWQKDHKGGTDFSQFYWAKYGS